ncbi:MAG: VIT domain-containing protein, partial [Thiotrichaceae bacterium]
MRYLKKILTTKIMGTVVFLLGSIGLISSANAAGILKPVSSQAESIINKSQHVTVTVEDGYAITQVDQIFHNPNKQDLEAVYSFPVPEKGTVSEFTMWIDGQPVTGEVLAKKKARQVYEAEKAAGREAGLTEKQDHYRFEVKVSSVRANSDQRIRFVYMQAADIDTGMGRYVYPLEEGETDEKALSFWKMDETVEDFSFTMKLRSSYPVDGMRLPAHPQAIITQQSANEWQIKIASDKGQSNVVNDNNSSEAGAVTEEAEGKRIQQANFSVESHQPVENNQRFLLDKDVVVYWRLAQ